MTAAFTIDAGTNAFSRPREEELFALTKKTVQALGRIAAETGTVIEPTLVMKQSGTGRFSEGSELQYLEAHLFRPGRRNPFPGQGDRHQIRILSCANPAEEAQAAVAWIRRLTRTNENGGETLRYRDIAVVAGDFPTYAEHLRRAFGRAEIPYFVDRSVPVTLNPAFEFVRAAFAILDANYSYESMMAFFRTGFVFDDRETVDILENYLLAAGIRGHKAWTQRWSRPAGDGREEEIAELEELREAFAERFEPFASVCRFSAGKLKDYARALWELTDAFDLQGKLSLLAREREESGQRADSELYSQAASAIAGVLDEAVSLLGDEKIRRTQFEQILEAGLSEAKIGIVPPGIDEVQIGDLMRSRITNVTIREGGSGSPAVLPVSEPDKAFGSSDSFLFQDDNGRKCAPAGCSAAADSPAFSTDSDPGRLARRPGRDSLPSKRSAGRACRNSGGEQRLDGSGEGGENAHAPGAVSGVCLRQTAADTQASEGTGHCTAAETEPGGRQKAVWRQPGGIRLKAGDICTLSVQTICFRSEDDTRCRRPMSER